MSLLVPGPRGSELFVDRSDDLPLCWVGVTVRGGAAADPLAPDLQGLAHHTATLARRGAGDRDREALDRAIDQIGASVDVHAGRDSVWFLAEVLARHVDTLIELVAEVLARPRMDPADHAALVRETTAQLDELRDDDGSLVDRYFDRHCAPGHRYARSALGTAASLAAIEQTAPDALRAAFSRWVAPDNLLLGFAGDIEPGHAERLAAGLCAGLPAGPPPPLPDVAAGAPTRGRRLVIVDKPERSQCQVVIGHVGPRAGTPEATAMALVSCAFGGTFSSRLMQEVRVKRGWSYGAGCMLGESRGPHWFRIQLAPAAEVVADAVELVLDMFADVAARGVTDDELAFAENYLVGSLPFQTATPRQRMRLAFLDAACGLPAGHHIRAPERLARVTPDQARATAARWLLPDDALVVVVATADEVAPALERAVGVPATVVAHDAY